MGRLVTHEFSNDLPSKGATAEPNKLVGPGACAICGKVEGKHKKCTRCLKASYCSEGFRVDHWRVHKGQCEQNMKSPYRYRYE